MAGPLGCPGSGEDEGALLRLIENGLVIGTELCHRKIKDEIVYLACSRTENSVHIYWTCPHS